MSTGIASRVGFVVALGAALAAVCLPLAGTAQGAVRCTIVGTSGADTLVGTSRKDVICGRGGKDILRGRGGGDVLDGGSGADTLDGGGGADKLLGGTGNDRLRGSGGGDLLFGQGGADNLLGGTGVDYLTGGGGADTLDGRDVPATTDYLYCQADPDVAFVDPQDLFGSDCETIHHAPTDIVLSNAEVTESQPAGTVVGTLSATDADVGDSHIFSLVGGTGSDDNARFQISGTQLQTSQILDHDADPSLNIRVQADDGHGGTIRKVFVISVEELTNPPALADIETTALTYTENEPAKAVSSTITVTDVDSASLTGATVSIASGLASGDELTFTDQLGVTGSYSNGVLTLTGDTSAANYQTVLRDVKYVNTSEDPGATTRVITFQAMDGVGPGHLSNTVSRNVAVTPVNDAAPVADDEFFGGANGAIGNTALVVNDPDDSAPTLTSPKKAISGDILAGDTDVEGAPLAVTPVTDQATVDGGRVTIEADGDFVFRPAATTSCVDSSDSFNYTVGDQDGGTDTGQVTVSISGCVWYVSNNAAGNSGTSDAPFDTLVQAEIASGVGHTVFVFDGDNTSTGYASGYALKSGQRLIGEHEGLVVGGETLHPANPGAHPTLTASGEDVVDLDDGNEVRGFVLDPQGTGGGIGGSGESGGTVDDVNIIDVGTPGSQPGLELDSTLGTFNISNLVVNNSAIGLRLNNAGIVNVTGSNTLSTTTQAALDVTNTTIGGSGLTFRSISANGAASGIVLNNTGATAGLTVTGTGTAGSGGTIQNSTGPGISLTSTTSPAFSFMNVQNGSDDGIRGSAVNGFSLTSSTVSGNGNDFEEHGLDFGSGLTGGASISNSTVSGSADNNVFVANSVGELVLTVTGSTFSNTSALTGNDGIQVRSLGGTATTVSVENSTFADNHANHFAFMTDFTSSGTNAVTFSDNTLTSSIDSLGAGIILNTDGSSDTTFMLAHNNIQGAVWSAIWVEQGHSSTAGATTTGRISENTIGNPAVANSGSSSLSAVSTTAHGSGTMTVTIDGNLLHEYGLAGIDIASSSGSPALNATVTGNTVSDPGTTAAHGLLLRAGGLTGDGGTVCASISGNTLTGSAPEGSTDFRLRQRFNTTVRLPGYSGGSRDTTAVVAFAQQNNPGAETGSATAEPVTGGGFIGGAACPTP